MRNKLLIAILGVFLTIFLNAKPAKPIISTLIQPDGSIFTSLSYGDEFMKITTTAEGHAIIRDNDGWWCYAIYNADGSRYSSGHHVGANVPTAVLAGSRSIPYKVLAERASARKSHAGIEEQENIMKRVRKVQGPMTKAG